MQLNYRELLANIMVMMHKSKYINKLVIELFLSNDYELILSFFSSTPKHFDWKDLDGIFFGYPFKIKEKNKEEIITNLTIVSRALIESKNITIIKNWTNHIYSAMLKYDYLIILEPYSLMCRTLISLDGLKTYYNKDKSNTMVLDLLQ